MPNAAAGCHLRWANMAAALGDVRLGWPDAAAVLRAAVVSIGNALEHDVVHLQCRRISFKRNGDDAPLIFGIRLADTRSGERVELALSAQSA